MVDNDATEFKIRFNDERPETQLQEEVENLRIKKLNRKVNLVTILIFCLLGVVLVFAYPFIKKRYDTIHNSGSSEIQTLSKDLESKFSSLSVRQAKIEALLANKISAIENEAARLQKNLDKTEKALVGLRSTIPDKKELAGVVSELDKTLTPIISDIKKMSSEIKAMEARLTQESDKLKAGDQNILNDIKLLKDNMSALAAAKVDKKLFDLAVRHEEKSFKQLQDIDKSLSEKIEEIRNRFNELEENLKKRTATNITPSTKSSPESAPEQTTRAQTTSPTPETIIEQEIKN